jgi:hypothetical protein
MAGASIVASSPTSTSPTAAAWAARKQAAVTRVPEGYKNVHASAALGYGTRHGSYHAYLQASNEKAHDKTQKIEYASLPCDIAQRKALEGTSRFDVY